MIYGYARVSSVGQAKDGNSIEAQTAALLERGCEEIYSEAYTGTTTDRPEFLKILGKIEKGDTLNKISIKIYGDTGKVKEICDLNKIKDPDDIKYGQKILLP